MSSGIRSYISKLLSIVFCFFEKGRFYPPFLRLTIPGVASGAFHTPSFSHSFFHIAASAIIIVVASITHR
nr:MAG TPA: hypothetical protein [Caudoviricetes sp.]